MKKIYIPFFIFSFLIGINLSYADTNAKTDSLYTQAWNSHEQIVEGNRTVGSISEEEETMLPIGIEKNIANQNYIVAVEGLAFDPLQTYLYSSMWLDIPQTGDHLAFWGEGVEILPHGITGSVGRMYLVSDQHTRITNDILLTVIGSEKKTYLEWDVNGFINLSLQGEFSFCSGFIQPVDPTQEVVKAYFQAQIQDWNQLLAKVSIDPFQLEQLKGVSFHVEDAYMDYSDLQNPSSILFPKNYILESGLPQEQLWKGFYLRRLRIKLSGEIFGSGRELRAENLLIDHRGVSGFFSANNLIPYSQGSLGGWAYSLDQLGVEVQCNSIKSANLSGAVGLPILAASDTLKYRAIVDVDGNYLFSISPPKKPIPVPLLQAELDLTPNSFIQIQYDGKKVNAKALLHGEARIKTNLSERTIGLGGITFQNLLITNERPYIQVGDWGIKNLGVENKISGFSIMIKEIKVNKELEDRVRLRVDLLVALNHSYKASSNLDIIGSMKTKQEGERQVKRWMYEETKLNDLYISVKDGSTSVEGYLKIMRKDPVYGDGFYGSVQAYFQPGITITAKAQFGNVNNISYWYVDGLALLPKGITTFVPGLSIYGFGGGAYCNMRQERMRPVQFVSNREVGDLTNPMVSPSGIRYVPDASGMMGFKARTILGTTGESTLVNGDVELEMSFNKEGGIKLVNLRGQARLMSKMEMENKTPPSTYGELDMYYDVDNKTLHGTAQVFMNVASGVIRGSGGGYSAGQMVIHFDPQDWYVHIGKPSNRIGLVVGVPIEGRTVGLQADAYLMAGTQIDDMPSPPPQVTNLLGNYYPTTRNESALFSGKGITFGASLSLNTGKMQMLIFYAQLQAGIGVDVMLANYGDAVCAGSNDRLGINGWYASGQAYAYLEGSIGIRVTVFKWVNIDEEILRIGAAVLLQAKLPNPFWMKGSVGGEYSLLGGKVRGRCDFEVVVGSECQIIQRNNSVEALMADMNLISQLTPAKNDRDIDICTTPQVIFSMPIEKSFTLSDADNTQRSYRIVVDELKLTKDGSEIPVTISWNEKRDVAMLNPIEVLEGEKQFAIRTKVHVEQLNSNGLWATLRVEGKSVEEIRQNEFTTAKAPDRIGEKMVAYSYPVNKQLNFFTQEYNQGYIILSNNFAYLFKPQPEYKQVARFTSLDNQQSFDISYSYYADSKQVQFSLPSTIRKATIYRLELVNVPLTQSMAMDANIKTEVKTVTKSGTSDVQLESKEAEGVRVESEEKIIYTSYFRTSEHATLSEKMNRQFNFSLGWRWAIMAAVHHIGAGYEGEPFDQAELDGKNALIQAEATANTAWFNEDIFPLVYEGYPLYNVVNINWRNINELGLLPFKTVSLKESLMPDYLQLTDDQISIGKVMNTSTLGSIVYRVPYHAYYDYQQIQQQVANLRIDNDRVRKILSTPFPAIRTGASYPVQIKYVLPGIGKVTTSQTVYIKNP